MFAEPAELNDSPRPPRNGQQLMIRVLRGARFTKKPGNPDPIWRLIEMCWKQNPKERPTFSGIVDEEQRPIHVGWDLSEYHKYRDRRLREAASLVGLVYHLELAAVLG
jgi:hypothetical protein